MVSQPVGLVACNSGRADGRIQRESGSGQFEARISQCFSFAAGDVLPSVPEAFHAVAGGVGQTVHDVLKGGGGRHAPLEHGVVA